jgi:hypothetical protein
MNAILGQVVNNNPRFWSWGDILIGIVVVCAAVALVFVALRAFKIEIPEWFRQVILIVVVAVVVIVAIRFVLAL